MGNRLNLNKKPMDEQLKIEFWWKKYLNLMQLKENKMPEDQIRETKRAFYGGFGMALVCSRDVVGGMKEEIHALNALIDLKEQVQQFMENEI